MAQTSKDKQLQRLRRELSKLSGQRGRHRGEPEGLRDLDDSIEAVKAKIRSLEQ